MKLLSLLPTALQTTGAVLRFVVRDLRPALTVALLALACAGARAQQYTQYAFGADVSFLMQLEDGGTKFKDGGVEKPGLQILQEHGYNWVRLRVCVEPVGAHLPNTVAYTVAMAKDARARGMKFLLDFHYSNAWADPTNEPTPAAWRDLGPDQLIEQIFSYTRDTIAAFRDAGVLPDVVQIGNEITNGFCWPVGKLPEHWETLAGMVYAGINGVDAGRGNNRRPKILLHVDHGGDLYNCRNFFDHIRAYGIPYDMIGLSFYPWSHGTLVDLRANLAFLANEYEKEVMVVETGYYYSPSKFFKDSPPPFPETPEGQKQWLQAVNEVVLATPHERGRGVFWWEPAASGGLIPRGYFDAAGNAQPVLEAFHAYTRPKQRVDGDHAPAELPSAVHFGPARQK